MKLIDLLVKELPKSGGWPKDAVTAIYFSHNEGVSFYDESGMGIKNGVSFICMDIPGVQHEEVTKEKFESALAASDGWIEWDGRECPVHESANVDIKLEDGGEKSGVPASAFIWQHDDDVTNIIAYRLHKPDLNSRANDDRLEQDLNECIGQDVDIPEWNGDGLPPIGCACEMQDSKGTWLPVDIIAKNDGFTFGWSYDYRIVIFGDKADEFRPLRTEAEKAREKLASSLHIAAGASPIELNGIGPLYFKLADAIISGSVFGTTFKENK